MALTFLAFHAHPDDEAILTGGTLACVAAAGHRVVVVTATDGALGLSSRRYAAAGLAGVRAAELRESARLLGVARVVQLGYADSGLGPVLFDDPPGQVRFVRASVDEAAERLAGLLREESVDVLLTYDINGVMVTPTTFRFIGSVLSQLNWPRRHACWRWPCHRGWPR